MNKYLMFSIVFGLILLGVISFIQGDENELGTSRKVMDKDFSKDKYQKIETENIVFNMPVKATHYWGMEEEDVYEVIINNLSIKDNEDYVLRITWKDERYNEDTFQIHYEFKNGRLKKEDIKLYPFSKYDKDCLSKASKKEKGYNTCIVGEPKINFKDLNIELGTLIGYDYKVEKDIRPECGDYKFNNCSLLNISTPIYSWRPYEEIVISKIEQDFIAIDDVGTDACGTITASGTYNLTTHLTTTGACLVINNISVTIDCKGYNITYATDGGKEEMGIISNYDNTIIKNCHIVQPSVAGDGNNMGIRFYADNGMIINNTFYILKGYAILISGDIAPYISNNHTIRDNYLVVPSWQYSMAIAGSSYTRVHNNIINSSDAVSNHWFIDFWYASSYNNVTYNKLYSFKTTNLPQWGIDFFNWHGTCDNNLAEYNQIFLNGTGVINAYLDEKSSKNTFRNNLIAVTGESSRGIWLHQNSYSSINNNTVIVYGNSNKGISFDGSQYPTGFYNSIIMDGTTNYGAILTDSINTTLRNTTIDSGTSNSIVIYSGTNGLTMRDSTLISSTDTFRIFSGSTGGVWNFTNVTGFDLDWDAGGLGTLNVYWYLGVRAIDSLSQGIEGASITINNKWGTQVYSGTTNATGYTPLILYRERYMNNENDVPYTPYLVSGTYLTYSNSTNVTLITNRQYNLLLGEGTEPPVEPPEPGAEPTGTFIQPLALKTWIVDVFSGDFKIFTGIAIIVIIAMGGFFGMVGFILSLLLAIFLIMFSGYVDNSVFYLMAGVGVLIIGYWIMKIAK